VGAGVAVVHGGAGVIPTANPRRTGEAMPRHHLGRHQLSLTSLKTDRKIKI
jgi:hypothetical protein